jgi:hypothetical protein
MIIPLFSVNFLALELMRADSTRKHAAKRRSVGGWETEIADWLS